MEDNVDRLGIDVLSVFGMRPPEFVGLTADLGCRHISICVEQMYDNPHAYAAWSFRDDLALRREFTAALRDRGIGIAVGEGFMLRRGRDIRDQSADIALLAELGAKSVNAVSIDPDISRTRDQYGVFAELAASAGVAACIEFVPGLPVPNLAAAAKIVTEVNQKHFGLVIDCMHVVRSGGGAADLAALDPASIAHIQICDAPLRADMSQYGNEAKSERLAPGAGELPLAELLGALPRGVVVGLEIPMLTKAEAGIGPAERLEPCVAAARRLLAQLSG